MMSLYMARMAHRHKHEDEHDDEDHHCVYVAGHKGSLSHQTSALEAVTPRKPLHMQE